MKLSFSFSIYLITLTSVDGARRLSFSVTVSRTHAHMQGQFLHSLICIHTAFCIVHTMFLCVCSTACVFDTEILTRLFMIKTRSGFTHLIHNVL